MYFLNTFKPLCRRRGRWSPASVDPPFVDASIRREPDFEHPFPAISCICLAGKFAPRLQVGDEVVYATVKGRYLEEAEEGWRLVGALRVVQRFSDHASAARWYHERTPGRLPSNCLVEGNAAVSLARSDGSGARRDGSHATWDARYWRRVARHPVMLACEVIRLDLVDPVQVRREDLLEVFGRVPGTRSGVSISEGQFNELLDRMRPTVRVTHARIDDRSVAPAEEPTSCANLDDLDGRDCKDVGC